MARPKAGETAPDFTLPDAKGQQVNLHALARAKPVVLFFYPKAFTPGCTAEACAFRDAYEDFAAAGAEVVGISQDTSRTQRAFGSKYRLPFTLLADPDGVARKAYGVDHLFGLVPGRITFVIGRDAKIAKAFASQTQPTRHVAEALGTVERLAAEPARH